MRGLRQQWAWTACIDVLLVVAAFTVAFAVRFGWPPPRVNFQPFLTVAPLVGIALLVLYFSFGVYTVQRSRLVDRLRALILSEISLLLITSGLTFWLRGFAFPRSVLAAAFGLHFVLALCWRSTLFKYQRRLQRVVVTAQGVEAARIRDKFVNEPQGWFDVIRAATPKEILAAGSSGLTTVDILVIGASTLRSEREQLLRLALRSHTTVQVVPRLGDILMVSSTANQVDDLPVFEISPPGPSITQRLFKRAFDLVLSVSILVGIMPLMVAVGVAIKLSGDGPVLFGQERVGLDGCTFTVIKFRTMVVDAEKATGPVLALLDDPRITRLGKFLRAFRIDELPQLWNVIRGEMSLVGPRPERPHFVREYATEIPDYSLRHAVPPGITGLAQVMGKYTTTAEDKLRFELFYVSQYSVWLDLQILLLTIRVLLDRNASAGLRKGLSLMRARTLFHASGEGGLVEETHGSS